MRPLYFNGKFYAGGLNGVHRVADRLIREVDGAVPILVTTAFDQTEYLTRAIDIGVETYVMKPVEGPRLHAALLSCARKLRLEAEADHRRSLQADLLRAEAVAVLAAGMAHDYNNLLQTVLGNLSLARELIAPDAPAACLLEEAEDAASEASALGAMLRRLAHRGPPPVASTDLARALRTALEDALEGHPIELGLTLPEGCPPVAIEETELRVVVRHLVANACEAMPTGGTLRVSADVVVDPGTTTLLLGEGSYVRIVFLDSGHGIAPESLSRVFDAYFSTKDRGSWRGMGLGLTVTRSILEHYRGTVFAESGPDGGAAVHVLVPVAAHVVDGTPAP